jgi:hypothetical protein
VFPSISGQFCSPFDIVGSFETFPSRVERSLDLAADFGSGLSGFDVTMDVLLFWLPPPGAGPGKARKIVEQALKMNAHWRPLNSSPMGTLLAAFHQGIPDWPLQKVLTFADADAVQFCSRMAERPCTWRIVPAAPGGCENTLRFSSMRCTAASRRTIYPAVSITTLSATDLANCPLLSSSKRSCLSR